jgi:hypothetical protein
MWYAQHLSQGSSRRVASFIYLVAVADILAIVILRYCEITIPSTPGELYHHGLSPFVRAAFDCVFMSTICFFQYLVSNWHSRSLGKLRLATLIEDRASLLAQVASLNINSRTHSRYTTPAPVHTQLWRTCAYVTRWPPYDAFSPPYHAHSQPYYVLSSPPDLFCFFTNSRYHTICGSRSTH